MSAEGPPDEPAADAAAAGPAVAFKKVAFKKKGGAAKKGMRKRSTDDEPAAADDDGASAVLRPPDSKQARREGAISASTKQLDADGGADHADVEGGTATTVYESTRSVARDTCCFLHACPSGCGGVRHISDMR